MNVWIPGLIVVAVGLAAGLWMALRGKQAAPADTSPGASPDPAAPSSSALATGTSPAAPSARRSSVVGFLAGVLTCAVLGGLIYWATQGSKPKEEMGGTAPLAPMAPMTPAPQPGAASPEAAARAHEESAELSPAVQAQLAQLRAQIQAAPQDLNARRQLTVALLNANLLMEAFEQARELQKVAPEDPDGLFVEGVVRLAMGQWPLTVQLMDRVLAQHPDHVLAALAKGQAEAALGQTPAAIATWKKGLAAAGGKFQPLEELIAEAESGGMAMASGAAPAPDPQEGAPAPESAGGFYRVHIELSPGTTGPRNADGGGATLFVALRGEAPGPPAAVKRVANPAFPLELTLSADDSMMGQPLPQRGNLSIHLDGDGNASTKEAGDLATSVQAFSGTPVTVILENAQR